jgi:glycosyltransferase involved in cell wall biosynthesis
MTILFITADTIGFPTGGGLVCHHEVAALKSLGLDVHTVSRPDLNPARYHIPDSPFAYDHLALDTVLRKLSSSSRPPRLVHFYSGSFSNTIRHLRSLGIPVTYTMAAHDRQESIREFETLLGAYPFPHVQDPHSWSLYSEGIRHADIMIAPSQASARLLEGQGARTVEIIPHGTETPEIVPPLPESFSAGYLGQPGPDKGLLYLIRAWGSLADDQAPLLLAGDGSDQLGALIGANVDCGRFELLGRVSHAKDLYERVSVYIQPSVTEGFGIEILEAMAYGRPVIVSEGAGGSDVVTSGEDGFVVPRRNPEAIAKHLRWFRANPSKTAEMGERAGKRARAFTWEIIRKKYAELWQAVIA